MATRGVGVTEGDLSDGVKAGVHALGRAEEPPGQEAEGPYERGSARNGRGAKGPRKVEGVTTADSEASPATVPQATQAGEVRARWTWTESSVWTERMLTALEQGVKGGVWFSLMDKVYAERTLKAAWHRVNANAGAAGIDHVTVAMYERDLDRNLAQLATQLRDGTYRPQAIPRTWIDKPGSREQRPLGIPTVRDRVVQTAVRMVLEPIFERTFAARSYGFRPLRGCKDALRRVDSLLTSGYTWVVDADLRHYFDTIPHPALMQRVQERVADGRVLALLEAFLTQHVLDGLSTWTPEEGTPQGAVISPLLANIYLNPLDHQMAERIQVDVCQQGTDDRALWRPLLGGPRAQAVQHMLREEGLEQREYPAVRDPLLHPLHQRGMWNGVEVVTQVRIDDPRVAARKQAVHAAQRVLASPEWSESVALRGKRPLEDRLQHHPHGRLNDAVSHRRDAQRALFPTPRFIDPGSGNRLRAVRAVTQLRRQLGEIAVQVPFIHRDGHVVDARRARVGVDTVPRRLQRAFGVDLVHQAEPDASFHALFERRQHAFRPHTRFRPRPTGADLSCLCSLRHCRRWRFRVCGRHALHLPGSLCSTPITGASSLVR